MAPHAYMKDIKRAMRLVYVIIQVINLSYWLESVMEKNQISQFMFVMYMNLIIVYVVEHEKKNGKWTTYLRIHIVINPMHAWIC